MRSKNAATRKKALDRVIGVKDEDLFPVLLEALDDDDFYVRDSAVTALGYFGDPRALDKLLHLSETLEQTEVFYVDGPTGKSGTRTGSRPYLDFITLVEAVGRIGDARALSLFAHQTKPWPSGTFHDPIRMSWAIASIGARAVDFTTKQQAARQLVRVFPPDDFSNKYIRRRLPWARTEMLDVVASLLTDPDASTRLSAAVFLSLVGDKRGSEILVQYLQRLEINADKIEFGEYRAVEALVSIEDIRVLRWFLESLNQLELPEYIARSLHLVLEKWTDLITPEERQLLTESVPKLMAHLMKDNLILTDVVEGIRLIHTEKADQLIDDRLGQEIIHIFQAFIERGDPSGVPDDVGSLSLISRSHAHAPNAGILSHPLMRQVAFPAMRARIDYLRRTNQADSSVDWLIACIGWLQDPQALPYLLEELSAFETDDPHGLWGEVVYAIGNLRLPESGALLAAQLQTDDANRRRDVEKALRFLINGLPDETAALALLKLNTPDAERIDTEAIEAIGRTGLEVAVPYLAALLVRRDDGCSEAINALAEIAIRNRDDVALTNEIVSLLTPMLKVTQRVGLNFFYQPLDTSPIDEFIAIVLRDIGTLEAQNALKQWEQKRAARRS